MVCGATQKITDLWEPRWQWDMEGLLCKKCFDHKEEEHLHFGLQFLLTGIFAAYYHPSRNEVIRPGFTSFPTDKKHDLELGEINVTKLRLPDLS